jgi:hypothetical protein
LASIVHLLLQRGFEKMSVIRIVLQPTSVRGASALADTVATKLHSSFQQTIAASAKAADLMVMLVTPVAVIALVLGLWRLTADLGWTDSFLISDGFFSHWQVWMALAIGLKIGASVLAAKMGPTRKTSEEN